MGVLLIYNITPSINSWALNDLTKKVSLFKLDKKLGSCHKHTSFLVEPLNE